MAARVTEEDVLAVLPTGTAVTETIIEPYIVSANVFVTDLLGSTSLTAETLKEIERWLTAHMVTVTRDRLSKEAGAGGAYIKYAGEWGQELASTQYGQMVLMLDTTNTLRNLKDGKKQAYTYAVPGE